VPEEVQTDRVPLVQQCSELLSAGSAPPGSDVRGRPATAHCSQASVPLLLPPCSFGTYARAARAFTKSDLCQRRRTLPLDEDEKRQCSFSTKALWWRVLRSPR
jgi:hypothetical protein